MSADPIGVQRGVAISPDPKLRVRRQALGAPVLRIWKIFARLADLRLEPTRCFPQTRIRRPAQFGPRWSW